MKAATRHGRKRGTEEDISIHAAREGGDTKANKEIKIYKIFQSTPPVKAATNYFYLIGPKVSVFQSTPPVKAATYINQCYAWRGTFQSTPPVKAATVSLRQISIGACISIHAAREGGDYPPII